MTSAVDHDAHPDSPHDDSHPTDRRDDGDLTQDRGSMITVVQTRFGPEHLAVATVPRPEPTGDQVLVQVCAASLNALDWHFATGTPYLLRPAFAGVRRPKRPTPGVDVAGRVVAVGPSATTHAVGDEVYGWCEGACAQYVAVPEAQLLPKPSPFTFAQAAAVPVAAFTALQGLRDHAQVRAGETVLVNGAAGGVGTFAVQIATALGAEVTAVCSGRNVDMVRALGADHVVDYETSDFVEEGRRYDVMIDNVGNRSVKDCLASLVPDGRYVMISGPKGALLGPVTRMIGARFRFMFASQSMHQFTAGENLDDLRTLSAMAEAGELHPAIERTLTLDEVPEAIQDLGTGHARAKLVVEP